MMSIEYNRIIVLCNMYPSAPCSISYYWYPQVYKVYEVYEVCFHSIY
jgi:hypothetical protein